MHVMKITSDRSSSATTPAPAALHVPSVHPAPVSTPTTVAPSQQHVPVPLFDRAIYSLLGNDEEVAKEAIALLLKIISNVISYPMEEKYRKVKNSSAAFNAKIVSVGGGLECLRAVGFQQIGEEWVLVPSAEAWPILLACQAKLDRFMIKYLEVRASASSSATQPVLPIEATNVAASGGGAVAEVKSPFSQEETTRALEQLMLAMAMTQPVGEGETGAASASAVSASSQQRGDDHCSSAEDGEGEGGP